MEADWEVEIGGEAPILDALWQGFVDLRRTPGRVGEIEEAQRLSTLAEALLQLNRADLENETGAGCDADGFFVWTSKCDFWTTNVSLEPLDPDEMDAYPSECAAGMSCYLDLLPRSVRVFGELDVAEKWVRAKVGRLRPLEIRCCRVDLVIRRAVAGEVDGLGVTAYVTGCGADAREAEAALGRSLDALVHAINEPVGQTSRQ
jgi:hypothetical protein